MLDISRIALFDRLLQEQTTEDVSIIVNNIGYLTLMEDSREQSELTQLSEQIKYNVSSQLLASQVFIPRLQQHFARTGLKGALVNAVQSSSVETENSLAQMYAATKALSLTYGLGLNEQYGD